MFGWLSWLWTPKRDRWYAAWEYDPFTSQRKWVYDYGPVSLTDEQAMEKFLDTQEIYWKGGSRMWTHRDGEWRLEMQSG